MGCLGFFGGGRGRKRNNETMPKVWTNLGWSVQDAYGPVAGITAITASAQLLPLCFSEAAFSKRDRYHIPPVKNLAMFLPTSVKHVCSRGHGYSLGRALSGACSKVQGHSATP